MAIDTENRQAHKALLLEFLAALDGIESGADNGLAFWVVEARREPQRQLGKLADVPAVDVARVKRSLSHGAVTVTASDAVVARLERERDAAVSVAEGLRAARRDFAKVDKEVMARLDAAEADNARLRAELANTAPYIDDVPMFDDEPSPFATFDGAAARLEVCDG